VTVNRPPTALTVARVQAIEIAVNWRWAPVMFLGTWLLAQNVLPARFPAWEISTSWLASAAAVIAGEAALLLHELAHALLARRKGQRVRRIVFHAGVAEATRAALATQGPVDVVLLMFAVGNAATAALSLVPLGASDGARALTALRSSGCRSGPGSK
jgi:hypothetical protein